MIKEIKNNGFKAFDIKRYDVMTIAKWIPGILLIFHLFAPQLYDYAFKMIAFMLDYLGYEAGVLLPLAFPGQIREF